MLAFLFRPKTEVAEAARVGHLFFIENRGWRPPQSSRYFALSRESV
jgi:hypothetical protein